MRRPPPVTSAAFGTGGVGKAPVGTALGSAPGLSPGTAFFLGPHLGAHHVARRNPGAAGNRASVRADGAPDPRRRGTCGEAEIGLLQALHLIAQPRRLLEFEVAGSG